MFQHVLPLRINLITTEYQNVVDHQLICKKYQRPLSKTYFTCCFSENIRDFIDSILLAKEEAKKEENEELMSQLTDTHLFQTIADIFLGTFSLRN